MDAATNVIAARLIGHRIIQAGAAAMIGRRGGSLSMQPIVTTGFCSVIIPTQHAGHSAVGDVVFHRLEAVRRRYAAPMLRTAVVGASGDEVRRCHDICLSALAAVMDVACGGATFARAVRVGHAAGA
ncbi:Xaa-Pro aminopeptidase [Salinisphaera sp. T31B1]